MIQFSDKAIEELAKIFKPTDDTVSKRDFVMTALAKYLVNVCNQTKPTITDEDIIAIIEKKEEPIVIVESPKPTLLERVWKTITFQ